MTTTETVLIIVWVVCFLPSYLLMRRAFKRSYGTWSKGDRVLGLFFAALTSPVNLIVGLLWNAMDYASESGEASW